jgi:hypothetical protein
LCRWVSWLAVVVVVVVVQRWLTAVARRAKNCCGDRRDVCLMTCCIGKNKEKNCTTSVRTSTRSAAQMTCLVEHKRSCTQTHTLHAATATSGSVPHGGRTESRKLLANAATLTPELRTHPLTPTTARIAAMPPSASYLFCRCAVEVVAIVEGWVGRTHACNVVGCYRTHMRCVPTQDEYDTTRSCGSRSMRCMCACVCIVCVCVCVCVCANGGVRACDRDKEETVCARGEDRAERCAPWTRA